jgi:hypothetical protein
MKTKIRSEMAEPDGTADEYARAKRLAKRFDVCIRSIRRWGDKAPGVSHRSLLTTIALP